ncbi:MAG TPA: serine/threonine-protein kinase [Ideonella sp.]|nr:serine/threonine-protein kinase [Ideonella sp.]
MSSQPPDEDDRTIIRPSAASPVVPPAPPPAPPAPPPPDAPTLALPPRAAPTHTAASSAGDSGNALTMGTWLGEFELTSVLGEGGFGIVYLAQDHSLERRVALKEYMPSALASRKGQTDVQVKSERHRDTFEAGRKSFVNEAKLLAQFDHPSLVKVYRFWEANGTAYMVMPFYEGITLKDKLRQLAGPPDEAWLMALLAPLTEALAVIHAENCFHRDIAPDNVILLAGSGKPMLLDFGAARRVIGDMTQALTVILKPGYAPVEQYAEAPSMKQGPWTDVYALAASVYFAIVGKTPPPSVSRLMGDSYVPMVEAGSRRYSERFLQAIDNALKVRPEERTQSIAALRAELGLTTHAVESQATRRLEPDDPLRRAAAASTLAQDDNPTVLANNPTAFGPALAAAAAAAPPLPPIAPAAPAARGKGLWMGVGAAVLVVGGAAAYFATGSSPAPAPASSAAPPPPSAAPVASPPPVAAAPGPATPAVTAAPPGPFDVQREFERVLAAQTPGYTVTAAAAKPQLRIGRDRLKFSVTAARAGYLSVLVLGPDGSFMLLYPNTEAPKNRIEAGQAVTLPQSNWPLETFAPTGPERFLAIVSKEPRDYSALSSEREYYFLKLPTGDAASRLAAQIGGTAPLLLGQAKGCSGAGCDEFGAAAFTVDVVER